MATRTPTRKKKRGASAAEASRKPPLLKRILLNPRFARGVRLAVAVAILAGLVALITPERIGNAAVAVGETSLDLGGKVANVVGRTVTRQLQQEVRALAIDTPTATATRRPTSTPIPLTPTPTLRPVPSSTPRPLFTMAPTPRPGERQFVLPSPPAEQLDTSAAANALREYFQAISAGQKERAQQYWSLENAATGRSVIDSAIERREKYEVKSAVPKVLPFLGNGVEVTVILDVTDANGKVIPNIQQKYQLRSVDGEWFITVRSQ